MSRRVEALFSFLNCFEFFDVFDSLLRWSNFVGVGDSSEDGDGDVPGDECNFLLNERRNEIVSLSSVL